MPSYVFSALFAVIVSGFSLIAPTVSGGSDVSLSGYSASSGRRGGPGGFMRMEMW